MSQFKIHLATQVQWTLCEACGKKIEGPYETAMDGSCACVNPVYFCSKDAGRAARCSIRKLVMMEKRFAITSFV